MKMTEFLKIMAPALKMMSENGISHNDWKYVDLYEQFRRMRELGIKHREAIRMLAEETTCSERTLERIFSRLSVDC